MEDAREKTVYQQDNKFQLTILSVNTHTHTHFFTIK